MQQDFEQTPEAVFTNLIELAHHMIAYNIDWEGNAATVVSSK